MCNFSLDCVVNYINDQYVRYFYDDIFIDYKDMFL